MTNATSVKDRLKRQAIEEKKTMQDKLVTYGLERTIYRLSISNYKERFTLKGGIFLYGDACENAFDQNQLRYISSLLVAVPEDILPDVGIGDISLRRYHYLQQTYLRMKSQKTVPRNQFRYFCSMIKNK